MDDFNRTTHPVDARVAARNGDGAAIEIAGKHRSMQ